MQALTAARKLIDRDHVVAAITSSYPELGTGAAEFQKKHIPVVHLWDSSPDIEAMGAALFGIGPWAPSSGEESARFAIDTLGAKRAVTFSINDPWSELVTTYFKEAFQKRGGVVEQSFSFNPQDSDFRAAFSRTRALAPDVVYSPISDNIVPFYTQLRQANLRCPVISSDVIAKEHTQRAPRAFEGIYQSQIKDPSGPEMERLAAAYQRKFGRVPGLPWYVAIGYDGVSLILYCVGKVGSSSPELTGCLAGIKDLPGVTQTFSFNAGGSSPQFERIFQIRKGAFLLADLSGS
jgi:branched-chain amino acid transport system substrate-binding protein